MQEAFVQVLRHVTGLRDVTSFRAWFYRILVNRSKRLARRPSLGSVPLMLERHDRADATAPTPDELALSGDEVACLRMAICELNEAHRLPLYLFYFAGLSEQEVAQALDVPLGTVKSRLHNARKRLKHMLDSAPGTPRLTKAKEVTDS